MVHGTVLIVWKIGTNTYLVKTVSGETVRCHGYQLFKVAHHPKRLSTTTTNIPTNDADEHEYFTIEKVLRRDPLRGYFVKWLGFPHAGSSETGSSASK